MASKNSTSDDDDLIYIDTKPRANPQPLLIHPSFSQNPVKKVKSSAHLPAARSTPATSSPQGHVPASLPDLRQTAPAVATLPSWFGFTAHRSSTSAHLGRSAGSGQNFQPSITEDQSSLVTSRLSIPADLSVRNAIQASPLTQAGTPSIVTSKRHQVVSEPVPGQTSAQPRSPSQRATAQLLREQAVSHQSSDDTQVVIANERNGEPHRPSTFPAEKPSTDDFAPPSKTLQPSHHLKFSSLSTAPDGMRKRKTNPSTAPSVPSKRRKVAEKRLPSDATPRRASPLQAPPQNSTSSPSTLRQVSTNRLLPQRIPEPAQIREPLAIMGKEANNDSSSTTEESHNSPTTPRSNSIGLLANVLMDEPQPKTPANNLYEQNHHNPTHSEASIITSANSAEGQLPLSTGYDATRPMSGAQIAGHDVHHEVLSFDTVQNTLAEHIAEFAADNQYFVKSDLARARSLRQDICETSPDHPAFNTDLRQKHNYNGMAGVRRSSPFAALSKARPWDPGVPIAAVSGITLELADGTGRRLKPHSHASAATITWQGTDSEVPSYTHCTYTRANVAAHNEKVLHFYPYFSDDVDDGVYDILAKRYYIDISQRQRKVRQNQEVRRVLPYAQDFLAKVGINERTVLYYLLHPTAGGLDAPERDRSCQDDFDRKLERWTKTMSVLAETPPSKQKLEVAAWACSAWMLKVGFSLWHVVRKHPVLKAASGFKSLSSLNHMQAVSCRVCHQHDCTNHIDFTEYDNFDILSTMDKEYKAQEGVGETRTAVEANDIDWPIECNFKRRVAVAECLDERPDSRDEIVVNRPPSRDKYVEILETVKRDTADGKGPPENPRFYPCYHPGFACSDDDAKCHCFQEGVLCEKACKCPELCVRRFRGCTCHAKGRKICFDSDKCICFALKRECDADLCKNCGAHESLNPENRWDEKSRLHSCRNLHAQLGIPKRTILGRSNIHGFGVFAGEAIKKDAFVGEYRGEMVLPGELQRRSEVYTIRAMSYLFMLTGDQDVDSHFVGNKMRYINHAKDKTIACNVRPKIVLCNMTPRILMFATRNIEIGEELFFNYGDEYTNSLIAEGVPDSDGLKTGRKKKGRIRQPKTTTETYVEPKYIQVPTAGGSRKVVKPAWQADKPETRLEPVSAQRIGRKSGDHKPRLPPVASVPLPATHQPETEIEQTPVVSDSPGQSEPGSDDDEYEQDTVANSDSADEHDSSNHGEESGGEDESDDMGVIAGHSSAQRKRRRKFAGDDEESDFQPEPEPEYAVALRRTQRARKPRRLDDADADEDVTSDVSEEQTPRPIRQGRGKLRRRWEED